LKAGRLGMAALRIYTPIGQCLLMKVIKRVPGLPVERALRILSGRWKAVLLDVLATGPQRTCDLEKLIAGLSQKVLIEQLRALEEHGLVFRRPVASAPQGIEYLLTPLGESLRPVLEALMAWGTHHANEVGEAHRLVPCGAVVRGRSALRPQANAQA
jgi:DNA-binding HxlR family transcriptional regulator